MRLQMGNDSLILQQRLRRQNEACRYCQRAHRNTEICHIMCKYCFGIHLKKNMKNGICPKLTKYTQKEKDKHALPCRQCEGHGYLEMKTVTIYRQTEGKYQTKLSQEKSSSEKRDRQQQAIQKQNDLCQDDEIRKSVLRQVLASMKLLQVEDQNADNKTQTLESVDKKRKHMKRKVLYKHRQIKNEICQTCLGAGNIAKLTHCCLTGCKKCNYEKAIVNKTWLDYKMSGFQCQQSFFCYLCNQDTIVGVKTLKLECEHVFHQSCGFKWLMDNNICPICRHIDFFINYQLIKMMVQQESKQLPLPKDDLNVLPADLERSIFNKINISDLDQNLLSRDMNLFQSEEDW